MTCFRRIAALLMAAAALASASHAATAPGGVYIGYYQEDPLTNPEDPMPGSLFLTLPEGNSSFSGAMSFTYVGCQTQSVGTISGVKSGLDLTGSWSGTVDGSPQSGSYSGRYNVEKGRYKGTYTNHGGKQFRDLRPCIVYWIAPNGTWELFAPGTSTPPEFTSSGKGRSIKWEPLAGTATYLLAIFDLEKMRNAAPDAVVLQAVLPHTTTKVAKPATLVPGRVYLYSVSAFDENSKRLGFTSGRFKAE